MLIAALSYFIGFWVVRSISHTSNAHFCFSAINEIDHFEMVITGLIFSVGSRMSLHILASLLLSMEV